MYMHHPSEWVWADYGFRCYWWHDVRNFICSNDMMLWVDEHDKITLTTIVKVTVRILPLPFTHSNISIFTSLGKVSHHSIPLFFDLALSSLPNILSMTLDNQVSQCFAVWKCLHDWCFLTLAYEPCWLYYTTSTMIHEDVCWDKVR